MKKLVVQLRGFFCLVSVTLACAAPAQTSLDREPPGPSSRRTGLAITEIMYNPRPVPGQASNFTHEFIEVFNSKPWEEDLSGFSITGAVSYVFPPNTILGPGAYLVVARVPGLIVTNYGITNVLGPWAGAETNRLSTEEGTVQLRHRLGALLLEVNYEDSPPWPEGPDGTGHSLVLARPSYGEDDFRAWAQSDVTGGSPGRADSTPVEPMATVFINEWQHHSDPVDWVELYNHSNDPVDMSGARLSDNPQGTNSFRIPDGISIPARGFLSYDQNQLGFQLFAGGETIFLWNSNRTRVIDVIDFRGGSNNVSQGRWPDGGPHIYNLSFRANGLPNNTPNPRPMRSSVVISEIMFNPISGNLDDEYVEIVNRNSFPVSLAGWEFVTGINYIFATNPLTMAMPPGAHWVIARNPTNLMAIHTNLSTNVNLFGPYGGTLANGGERILLAAADYDLVQGSSQPERLNVPMSELIYGDGGKWGNWIDGQGSSLELIDYEGDERHPSNWADSTDVPESLWTHIEYNGPAGEKLGTPFNERLILLLQGIGECLLDEVEVRVDNGPNLVVNGGFEDGLAGWSLQGSHDFSTLENAGYAGSKSLHVRAGSRGDNQSNRILSPPLSSIVPANATNVSLRAKVKWLRGHPEFLLRLHGSATEAYGRLALPRRLGSPGSTNSVRAANLGPAIYEVKHSPLLPAPGADVVVTARGTDRQTPFTLTLRYRVDPAPAFTDVMMRDDGTGGDAIMNDGIYSAILPGQTGGAMVAFHVEGRDNLNGIGTFPNGVFPAPGFTRCWPNDAVTRECVVRWGEPQMPGDFATYHLWVSSANSNRWHHRDTQNNTSMDGTFVYNNTRVIYNALPLFSGSPWHRTNATSGPAGTNRVDYEMNFPDDEPLVGATDFVLNNPGNPDRLTISDLSAVAEQTVYKIFEGLGLPHNHRRYIHFFVNGSQRSTCYERPGNFIFEDSQQPNGDMINQWFPDDAGGLLFKVEDWFEFDDNGFDITAFNDADLLRRTVTLNGQPAFQPGTYRFMFRKRSVNVGLSANDYSAIYSLIDAASPAENPNGPTVDPDLLGTALNWEEWMRHFAVQRAVGNWDSYGWERGKNDYLYTTAQGFVHLPWDIDYSMGLGRGPTEPLFASNDPRVAAMFNTPAILRAYWRAFDELVNGPFRNAHLDPHIDARASALLANNVNIDPAAVAAIKSYIGDRRAYLLSQLATVAAPFAVTGATNFSTVDNLIFITGSAPVNVKDILLNGAAYPITWTSATNFLLRVVLGPGLNTFTLEGMDRFGAIVPGASVTLGVDYTGPVPDPVGALTLTELHYAPPAAGQQFIEIVNRSTFAFDLAGWRIDGVTLTFPAGSIITNGQTIVLAQNRNAFRAAFGNGPVFALFGGSLSAAGEPVAILRPAGFGYDIIDGVRYESAAPWSGVTPGQSLQLIDAAQDNSRPGNWAGATPTPGATNAVAGTIAAYDPIWLNEIQIVGLVSNVLDNAGDPDPWIELHNSGPVPLSLHGYYLASSISSNLTEFAFPPGTMISPGEHLVVWADGEPVENDGPHLHTGFRLDISGQLALVRLVGGLPQVTDYLKWTRLGPNTAHGGSPDGQSVYRFTLDHPTPRAVNVTRPLRVFVNEWMARNANGVRDTADNPPAADDWFEIYNAENFTVNLGGFYLTDDTNAPTQFQIPDTGRYQIPPRGYLLVWADEQTNQNSLARADLHAAFNLGGSGGAIGLYAPDGVTPIDIVSYGAQAQDVGEGRFADGASAYPYSMPLATTNSTPRGTNTIAEYNSPPLFLPTANQIGVPGQNCCGPNGFVDLRSLDPDGDMLTYSVVSAPAGSLINGARYRWPVPAGQPPGEYPVLLRVTDNGTPPRSDLGGFTIIIPGPGGPVVVATGPPIYRQAHVAGQFTFSFESTVGRRYRILFKDNLNAPDWLPLGLDFVAANDSASVTDPLAAPHRFYVVQPMD